jgi:AAA family ATP:ADP antiporter
VRIIATRLSDWLGLRPGERWDAASGFTILLLVISGHAMLETARDTLFLSELPVTRLPWAYLTIAGLALVLGATFSGTLARYPRSHTLTAALIVGAVVNVVFWNLCAHRRPETLFALYVWTGLIASLVTLQFWLLAGDVFDVGRAKRVFAFVGAGGLAGATLGAGLAGLVVMVASPRTLILGSATLFAIASVAAYRWGRHRSPRIEHAAETTASTPPTIRSLARDPYLRGILIAILVAAIVATGVDYLFKASIAAYVPRARLASFLARYHTIVNAGALAFQLLIAPRLLQGIGVVPALGVLPALLLLGTATSGALGGLVPALLMKAVDGTMRHSLDRAGNEILYLPLAAAVRERFKAITTSLGQRGGQAMASVGILLAGAVGASHREIAIGLAILSGVWLVTLARLRGHYIERFRHQLRALSTGIQGTLPPLDQRSLEVLLAALASSDDAEVMAALDMLEAYDKGHLVSPLLVYHPSRVVALRALAFFADSSRPEAFRFVERLLQHDDGDVRAAVLRMRTSRQPDEAVLRRHLRDPHSAAVRCTALVGLIAGGFVTDEDGAARMLREILEQATPDACPILATTLRDLPRFASLLASELSRNPDTRFGTEVAKAIAADPSVVFLETLLELLPRREARAYARDALVKLGDVALDRLATALDDPATPAAVRLHVPRSISRFGTARAAAILVVRLVHETDDRLTYKILRGLGRMRTDDPQLPVDRDALLAVAEALLARSVTMLTYRVAWSALDRAELHPNPPRALLLPPVLEETERHAVEAVFRVLHIIDPEKGYDIAFRGLAASDAAARASGRELLENLVQGPLRKGLLAVTDTLAPAARLAAAIEFYEPPGAAALLALVAEAADETSVRADRLAPLLRELVDRLLADRSEVVHAIARYQLDDLAWPSDSRVRAGAADGH